MIYLFKLNSFSFNVISISTVITSVASVSLSVNNSDTQLPVEVIVQITLFSFCLIHASNRQ